MLTATPDAGGLSSRVALVELVALAPATTGQLHAHTRGTGV